MPSIFTQIVFTCHSVSELTDQLSNNHQASDKPKTVQIQACLNKNEHNENIFNLNKSHSETKYCFSAFYMSGLPSFQQIWSHHKEIFQLSFNEMCK